MITSVIHRPVQVLYERESIEIVIGKYEFFAVASLYDPVSA